MEAAGVLMGMGIDFPKIVDQTFFTKTYEQNRIMGLALVKSKLHLDGKCISSIITAEEMREYRGTLSTPGKESPYRNRRLEENLD